MTGRAAPARLLKVAEVDQAAEAKDPVGVVYFLRARRFVKIGWTAKFASRRHQLQSANPHRLELMHLQENCSKGDESMIQLFMQKYHHRGEWYRHDPFFYTLIHALKEHGDIFAVLDHCRRDDG